MFKLNGFLGLVSEKLDETTVILLIANESTQIPNITSNKFLASCNANSVNIGDLLIVWNADSNLDKNIVIKQYICIGSIELPVKKEAPPVKKVEFVYTTFTENLINDPTCPPSRIPPVL